MAIIHISVRSISRVVVFLLLGTTLVSPVAFVFAGSVTAGSLVSIPAVIKDSDAVYSYDPEGNRVSISEHSASGTTVTNFPTPSFSETTNTDGLVEHTVSISVGGVPLATVRTVGGEEPQIFSIHTDQLGSTRLVTDETSAVVESTDYDPFGKILSDQTIPSTLYPTPSFKERRKFTSHEFDAGTSYTYAKARYLDTDVEDF